MTTTTCQARPEGRLDGRLAGRLDGRLDGEPSRGRRLVTRVLLVPHAVVLSFLWVAFAARTMVAGAAILVTGGGDWPEPSCTSPIGT